MPRVRLVRLFTCRLGKTALWVATIGGLAAPGVFAQTGGAPSAALRIVVIEGEDAVNIIQQKTAVAPVVEVRDRNDLPVSGAVVTFTVSGNSATFGGGLQALTVTTNAAGRAAVTALNPVGTGALQINVQAAFQGQTAVATISQTNVLTAAEAAASGSGASSGAGAAGGAGGAGGGLSGAAVAGVTAGAAGAVAAGVAVAKNDSETNTATAILQATSSPNPVPRSTQAGTGPICTGVPNVWLFTTTFTENGGVAVTLNGVTNIVDGAVAPDQSAGTNIVIAARATITINRQFCFF